MNIEVGLHKRAVLVSDPEDDHSLGPIVHLFIGRISQSALSREALGTIMLAVQSLVVVVPGIAVNVSKK